MSKNLQIFFVAPILIEKVRRWKYTVTLLEKVFSIKQGGTLLNITSVNQCWIRGDNYKAKACSIWDAFLVLTFFERGSTLIYRAPSGIIPISSKTGLKITQTRSDPFWMSNFFTAGAKIAKFDHLGSLERKMVLMKLN